MKLTRFISREYLLIMIAISIGMFSQEMVSRITSADDQPDASEMACSQTWQSAETFYYDDQWASSLYLVNPVAYEAPVAPVVPPAEMQIAVVPVSPEAPIAPSPEQPRRIGTTQPVAIVAQSPHTESAGSWTDNATSTGTSTQVDSAYDESPSRPAFPPTASASSQPPAEQVAVAAEATPAIQRGALPSDRSTDGQHSVLPAPQAASPAISGPSPNTQLSGNQRPIRTLTDPPRAASPYHVEPPLVQSPLASDNPYVSPAELVRQRAIAKGEARRQRVAARKWAGYSPLRPPVAAVPYMSSVPVRPIIIVPHIVVETNSAETNR